EQAKEVEGARSALPRRGRASDRRDLQKLAPDERLRGRVPLRRTEQEIPRRDRGAARGGVDAGPEERAGGEPPRANLWQPGKLAEGRSAAGGAVHRGDDQGGAGHHAEPPWPRVVAQARGRGSSGRRVRARARRVAGKLRGNELSLRALLEDRAVGPSGRPLR